MTHRDDLDAHLDVDGRCPGGTARHRRRRAHGVEDRCAAGDGGGTADRPHAGRPHAGGWELDVFALAAAPLAGRQVATTRQRRDTARKWS